MVQLIKVLFAIAASSLTGCVSASPFGDAENMYIKASALTKLSAAVEATVRYESPPEDLSDKELLHLATKHDPSLLSPFEGYTLKVNRANRHAVVLVCSEDGVRGLLEDVGCSSEMDKYLWETKNPCTFSISASEMCN